MTWIDGAALIIILLSAIFSMVRGFVREILALVAWFGAGLAAIKFYPVVMPEILSILPKDLKHFAIYGAMAAVFIIVLIVLSLLSTLISGLVRNSALSGVDRSLGFVFGAVRGAVLICLAYVALSIGVAQAQWPAPVVNARFLPLAQQGAKALVNLLPKNYRPKVDSLPGPKTTPPPGSPTPT